MEKSNKLIAEFMQKGSEGLGLYDYNGKHYKLYELKFHTSWDWLMPVIEKIQDKHLENPELDYQHIDDIRMAVPNKQEVYYLVLKFIKDQNTIKNN